MTNRPIAVAVVVTPVVITTIDAVINRIMTAGVSLR